MCLENDRQPWKSWCRTFVATLRQTPFVFIAKRQPVDRRRLLEFIAAAN
jgi:hypothetical protein